MHVPGAASPGFRGARAGSSLVARPGTWKTGAFKPQIRPGLPEPVAEAGERSGSLSPRSWHSEGTEVPTGKAVWGDGWWRLLCLRLRKDAHFLPGKGKGRMYSGGQQHQGSRKSRVQP